MISRFAQAMAFAAILLPACSHAHGWCEAQFEGTGDVMLDAYDPFAAMDAVKGLNLNIRNTGTQDCQYRVYFVRTPEIGAFSPNVEYMLNDASGAGLLTSSELTFETAHSLISPPLEPSATGQLDFMTVVPRGQYSEPGDFSDTVTVILTSYEYRRELDRATLRLRLTVKSVLDVSILGGSLGTEVDFGELATGQSRTLVLQAKSNEEYALSVISERGGALVHSEALEPDQAKWSVPYDLSVDGVSAVLNSGAYLVPGGAGSETGRNHQLIFTILDADNRRAGLYTDTLTVRIEPKL